MFCDVVGDGGDGGDVGDEGLMAGICGGCGEDDGVNELVEM